MLDIVHRLVTDHPYPMMVLSFFLAVLTDAVWARWSASIHQVRPVSAANWSVLIYVFGVVYTLVIIEKDMRQILAYVLGAWIGTYVTVFLMKARN